MAEPTTDEKLWYPIALLVRLRAFEALRHREYRLLWYGQVFGSMGTWMDQVTRGWLIYELTNSALHFGLVRGIQAIPFFLLSPIAGSAADRYPRKFQVVCAQFASGFLYAVTAALVFTGVDPTVACLCDGVFDGLRAGVSATFALGDDLRLGAGKKSNQRDRLECHGVQYGAQHGAGPVGLVDLAFRHRISYAVQAVFILLATVWTMQMSSARYQSGHPAMARASAKASSKAGNSAGAVEVRTGILIVIVAALFMIPFSTLLPVFARDLLHVGAGGQGLAVDVDGYRRVVQFDLDRFGRRPNAARAIDARRCRALRRAGSDFFGVIWFPLSMALMAVIGLCHVSSHALVQTVIQTYSPPEFRGRAIAIFHMTQVLLLVGGMLVGALSALFGAPWRRRR